MKYHEYCSDKDDLQRMLNREEHWNRVIDGNNCLSRDEIVKTLIELQRYFDCDFPSDRRNCDKETRDAVDSICRIAMSLAQYPDPMQRGYVSEKLRLAIGKLQLDEDGK